MEAMTEEDGKALKRSVIDHLMTFMEVFTSRSNLTARLGSLWTEVQASFNITKSHLLEEIKKQLNEGAGWCMVY